MESIKARLFYYPTLLWNVARKNDTRRWFDRIDECIVMGALPFRSYAHKLVKEESVRGVVTMNEEYETRFLAPDKTEWEGMGVEQIRISTVDFYRSPSLERIGDALDFIENVRQNGSSVYVHCKAGRGRSATIVLCYLMKRYNYNVFNATEFLRSKRSHIKLCPAQQLAVHQFYKLMTEEGNESAANAANDGQNSL